MDLGWEPKTDCSCDHGGFTFKYLLGSPMSSDLVCEGEDKDLYSSRMLSHDADAVARVTMFWQPC